MMVSSIQQRRICPSPGGTANIVPAARRSDVWLICFAVMIAACGSREVDSLGASENESSTGTADAGGTVSAGSSASGGATGPTDGANGTTVDGLGTGGNTGAGGWETGAGTTNGSTGESIAVCGNSILEAFGPVPEECDDGNLDPEDGCGETCALDRRVFVTSSLYTGGDFKTLKTADALCANLADDQGWPDGLKYRAWLSNSTTDARDRFVRGRGRLVLVNGLVLAASWSALLAGQLENPLEVTEKSETYHGGVWTGTRADGTAVPNAEHCEDWATESVLPRGYYGYSDRATKEWSFAEDSDQPSPCNSDYAIYCFQSL